MSATAALVDLITQATGDYSYLGTISSDTTTTGDYVDCDGIDGPVHGVIILGDSGDASTQIVVKLQEHTAASGSGTDIAGATTTFSASATANDKTLTFIRSQSRTKRYVRAAIVTSGGGTPSVPIAVAVFGKKKISGSGTGTYVGF